MTEFVSVHCIYTTALCTIRTLVATDG